MDYRFSKNYEIRCTHCGFFTSDASKWGAICPKCDNVLPRIELRKRKFKSSSQAKDYQLICIECQIEFSDGDEYRNIFYPIFGAGEIIEEDKRRICAECYRTLELPDFE